ncbi:MAG: twin-arginine translocase subunit TatC [Flavobacteriales bacterium]|jgi:sec-independent protein translocase protein TatC|nr:twin-arginine translocase subunit TatC [Flavobacteriales bacterium]MDA7762586.1 twin-arginine translocase subunit TatC [Crocinitomicaceae bacterium]MBT5932820.1 twin-arginine translocase subunit TatC [Flavobacteriales bacterium]MDA8910177.1 twin-arginine translocase subunit TatC [Crocinitomicaceae bacterium]MDC0459878.1 twin-arginine translocase subunit TatC [Crocinitomicaceae bacterium]
MTENKTKENSQMSFLEHLEELRWRLVRCAIAIVSIGIVIWVFQEWIMENVFLSMKSHDFISFRLMCEWFGTCVEDIPVQLQSMTVSGQFGYALMMSFMGGLVLGFPYIFYQIWAFLKPGLKFKEKKMAKGIVFYVSLLFFLGISFGYLVVAPLSIQFFGSYQISGDIRNDFTISSYMSTILSTVFYTGLFFLLPVIIYLLSKVGLITPDFLKKYRKHALVVILILSALITPPDVISQIIVSIPILILYEIGILVSKKTFKKEEN